MGVSRTCGRCGQTDRNTRGDCRVCGKRTAAERRAKNAREQPQCSVCGNIDWTAKGICRQCKLSQAKRTAEKLCPVCNGPRNRWGACLTCKRKQERQRLGVKNAHGQTGVGQSCAICSVVLTNTGPAKYALDHDHKTGSVRDWLCVRCNAGLGNFNEDPAVLEKAILYITRHRGTASRPAS